MATPTPTRTLYAHEDSRAFRVTWLLCELGLASSTTIRSYDRVGGKKAEEGMRRESGFALGKSPVLVEADGLQIVESGNILQYLADDFALVFSVQYVLAKRPGMPSADSGGGAERWPEIEAWLGRIEARPGYKQAVEIGAKHSLSLIKQ